MSRVPKNIKDMLETQSRIEAAEDYSRTVSRGSATAKWHEKDLKRSQRTQDKLAQATFVPGGPIHSRDTGLKTGLEVVKLARQARLRELFQREALQYEAELNSMGLALVKPRD